MSKRLQKISQAIQQELGDIIIKVLKDPALSLVSITRVDISPDIKHANVFFTSVKASPDKVKERLGKAKGVLKSELVKRIRLKYTPDLNFIEDKGIEHSLKISRMLRDLEEKEQKE